MNYNQAAAGFSIELQSSCPSIRKYPIWPKYIQYIFEYITKYTKMAIHILLKHGFTFQVAYILFIYLLNRLYLSIRMYNTPYHIYIYIYNLKNALHLHCIL